MSIELTAKSLDLAIAGQWDEAHQIVQDLDNIHAYWIHAVLHRIEGDKSNAQYWYARADREYISITPKAEFLLIKEDIELDS